MIDKLLEYQNELDNITKDYEHICKAYADAKQVYQRLDMGRKTLLSRIAGKSRADSEASRMRVARASEDYCDYLRTMAEARKAFLYNEASKDAAVNRIEALRTLISLNKSLNNFN